ncbi:helix-turn-helix transcriptional regulator [Xanthovirga aplysinae]|uniref:helix-turn-helix transcriptional regulator n=1 Tax=Xanthovirga aplysinae TaxID=2529853 RepID=UPI0012BCA0FF|nr:YafY family protein [Xanthovirga aplysinae]MTI31999.1 YafY family transcriptional regulator [Xanthovirga aplysinae]
MSDKEKPRLARLTSLLTDLQSKRLLTAKELAEKYDVSTRTVYRDIRTLENSGVPIVTEEGKGYSLVEGYNLPPVMFSEEEANALITAEKLIIKNKDISFIEQYQRAITKIKAVLRSSQRDKVDLLSQRIVFRNNPEDQKTSDYLMVIQSAITNSNLINLEYFSLQNEHSNRIIEPFALYSTQDNWLLIAFCRLRNDFRTFRLDHIRNLQIQNQHFEPQKITLQEYFEKSKEKYQNTPDTPLS